MASNNGGQTSWRTDRWFVSPWNYLGEVTRDFAFPKSVRFHDVCLRDGEQQAGVEFTPKEKVKLATMLAEAGVHRIEAGMPAVSKYDAQAVREIRVKATEDQVNDILLRVKSASLKNKGLVEDKEFRKILQAVVKG